MTEDLKEKIAFLMYKGADYCSKKKFAEAIKSYDEILAIEPDYLYTKYRKALVYYELRDYCEAGRLFSEGREDIIDLLIKFDYEDGINELLSSYLNYDVFFNQIVNIQNLSEESKELYKDIYIQSLRIVCKLHVNDDYEKTVAHYTRKSIAEILLFPKRDDNNKILSQPCLQLGSIVTANDPKEGETLFDYLFDKQQCTCGSHNVKQNVARDYQAFVSCFTFNHDSLNQFRLYGKEDNREATGVSLVMKNDFFQNTPKVKQPFGSEKPQDDDDGRLTLFRCIYIDPVSQQVVSLGHREAYTFYRDNISSDDYDVYHDEYKVTLQDVKDELEILKLLVNDEGVDHKIVCELLMNLRYLVKHVAFKEEQECRILDIVALDDERVKIAENRMYIEYSGVNIAENVKKVYFAPKTKGFAFFSDRLRHEPTTRHIGYEQSDHPFL